jgi:hypothetical protein
MAKYYFVGTLLPVLSYDTPPDITFQQLIELLRENLTKEDYAKTLVIRRFFDILNLRALWLGEDLDSRGELTPLAIGEALVSRSGLPDYVFEFLDAYDKAADRLKHFPFLLSRFFKSGDVLSDPFLKDYMQFERELRLVMTAFRAKKLGKDLAAELQYEDPEEEIIAQILAQKDAKVYEPPEKYHDLKIIFEKYGNDPMALQRALDEYRFETIENMVDMSDTFSIERILAYMTQLILVEKWYEIDKDKGIQIVDTIVKEGS